MADAVPGTVAGAVQWRTVLAEISRIALACAVTLTRAEARALVWAAGQGIFTAITIPPLVARARKGICASYSLACAVIIAVAGTAECTSIPVKAL